MEDRLLGTQAPEGYIILIKYDDMGINLIFCIGLRCPINPFFLGFRKKSTKSFLPCNEKLHLDSSSILDAPAQNISSGFWLQTTESKPR